MASDKDKHALNVVQEVRTTEKNYVADLQTLLTAYARPLKQQKILGDDDLKKLFSCLEEISGCNTALSEALQREGEPIDVLATAFMQVGPFLKLYASYCKNYETALATLSRCRRTNHAFAGFCTKASASAGSSSIDNLIIKPVQRLMKYPLFFGDLRSCCDGALLEKLEKAAALVRAVSHSVDASMATDAAQLVSLLEPLGPEWLRIIAPHRRVTLEFECWLVQPLGACDAQGFLLGDLLLLCKKRHGGGRLKPRMLLRLRDLLSGDEAMEASGRDAAADERPAPQTSGCLLSPPTTGWALPIRLDTASVQHDQEARLELHSAEALATLEAALEDGRSELVRLSTELRERRGWAGFGSGSSASASASSAASASASAALGGATDDASEQLEETSMEHSAPIERAVDDLSAALHEASLVQERKGSSFSRSRAGSISHAVSSGLGKVGSSLTRLGSNLAAGGGHTPRSRGCSIEMPSEGSSPGDRPPPPLLVPSGSNLSVTPSSRSSSFSEPTKKFSFGTIGAHRKQSVSCNGLGELPPDSPSVPEGCSEG